MKRITLLVLAALSAVVSAYAQGEVKCDTIVGIDNDTIIAKILKHSAEGVEFTYPGEDMVNHYDKLQFKKIILSSGRIVEEYSFKELPNGDNLWERQLIFTDMSGQYVGKRIITVEADIADSFNEQIVKCKTKDQAYKVADTHLRYAYAAYKAEKYDMAAKGVDAVAEWYYGDKIGPRANNLEYHIKRINRWLEEAGYARK